MARTSAVREVEEGRELLRNWADWLGSGLDRLGSACPCACGRTVLLMPRLCWRQRNRPSAHAEDQRGGKKEGDLKKKNCLGCGGGGLWRKWSTSFGRCVLLRYAVFMGGFRRKEGVGK